MKRVLVVSYYFPPSGGPGVQRVLKFVRYLGEFGFAPTVLTVREGAFPQFDPTLATEIPSGVHVQRTGSLDPFNAYARLTGRSKKDAVMIGAVKREGSVVEAAASWIRANVFVPDARVGWVPFATRAALRMHDAQPFDAMLTSGPPHSAHLIGRAVKRRRGLPWVADFRDPWTGINFYHELPMGRIVRRFDQRLERSVLREADRVTTVGATWARLLSEQSGRDAREVAIVHNGFDEADFEKTERKQAEVASENFTLAHVGSLYPSRNPTELWAAIRALRSAGRLERLRIRLVGTVDASVHRSLEEHELSSISTVEPYAPHAEAITIMAESALLLLVIEPSENAAGMITGKLYEYLASGRPVIALGEPHGDADNLIRDAQAGSLLSPQDTVGMAKMLEAHYAAWEEETPLPGATREAVSSFTRRAQTGNLADVLRGAMASASSPRS